MRRYICAVLLLSCSGVAQAAAPKPQAPVFSHFPTIFDPHSLKNDCGLWVEADALCWQSNMGGLRYGLESNSTSTLRHGHTKELDFEWDWGVRAGVGYKMPHDKWDLFVGYTYVHAHAEGHAHKSHGGIFPTWAVAFGFTGDSFFVSHAKAHWNANVNVADLELGRTCFAGRYLTIRPFMGVRGLVIDQDYHIHYSGGTAVPGDTAHVHLDTDFWGVGLRMGIDSLWGLGKGFGIYGNGSFALLSGDFDVHEREKLQRAHTILMKTRRDIDNVVVTADLALGLQWDYMFSKDRYHFGMKLGWEFNIFCDQNQLFNFVSPANPGAIHFFDEDLSFQGVTVGFRFDF